MDFSKLTTLLDQILDAGIPGYDCAVFYQGEPVYRRWGGYSDRETETEMQPDLLYNIYSATKVITVTAALQLVDAGKLRLSDPLSLYLPEFSDMMVRTSEGLVPAKSPITIRNLFCMTAGFNYDLDSPAIRACREKTGGACPTRELVRYLAREPLQFHPGRGWCYSLCHDVLGAVIEVVSGQTLGEYMNKHIFRPCGMKDTAFRHQAEMDKQFCSQYVYHHNTDSIERISLRNIYVLGSQYESGGAGLISTVDDYCRFQEALASGRLLKKETLELMQKPHLNRWEAPDFDSWFGIPGYYGYGLGVRVVLPCGPIAPPEFGWGGAAGALTMIDTKNQVTMYYAQHVLRSGGAKAEPLRARIKKSVYEGIGIPWKK